MTPHARRTAVLAAACLLGGCAMDAFDWQGRDTPGLGRYKAEFARDVGERFEAAASAEQVLAMARSGRVLWLGDHHRDPVLHACQLGLLQRLWDRDAPLVLGLEALGTQDQAAVDLFLRGHGNIEDLAAQVRRRWPESWLDSAEVDAAFYRNLLLAAQRHGSPVFALEPAPRLPLSERDRTIAAQVGAAARKHGDRLIVVVVGQSHLLGQGDLVGRTALPGLVIGAEPPPHLRLAAPSRRSDDLLRTDAGVWFFAALLQG